MQLSSRILTALAVLILAVAVVAVRGGSSGTVEAATGTIDVLNVGTCYTTNSDAFTVGDCKDADDGIGDNEGYSVAGRDAITQVATGSSVYATYAIDPKTSGDAPRAILTNSDLIQISIDDKGRDKRTGKLYTAGATGTSTLDLTAAADGATGTETRADVIADVLGATLAAELNTDGTPGVDIEDAAEALFTLPAAAITDSGVVQINTAGTEADAHPMAPRGDGKIVWFGTVTEGTTTSDFQDLKNHVSLDEDLGSGVRGEIAPWMRVTVSVPSPGNVTIQAIYFQTSQPEILAGGKKKANYIGYTDAENSDNNVDMETGLAMFEPVFVDDENEDTPGEQDALALRASADGDPPSQNLWLKETGDFTGVYEGFVRLTDADGIGDADDATMGNQRDNWGLDDGAATGSDADGAAVIGVESGPVTISYRNSNGDTRTATILIDKDPPAIQIDSPVHNTSSKDDSPDILGSFSDGGGAGLRDNSFRVYADNKDDTNDDHPIWDFRVDGALMADNNPYGYVCVDADDDAEGLCEDDGVAALRGHYAGYGPPEDDQYNNETFGIIKSMSVYHDTETDGNDDDALDYKARSAEDYEDGDTSGIFDTVIRIDFPPARTDNRYNNTIDIQAVVLDIAGNFGFSDSQPSDPTFIHDYGTVKKDRDKSGVHNVLGWYSRHQYRLDDVDPEYRAKQSVTGFFTDENGDEDRSTSGVKVVFDNDVDASSIGVGTFVVKLDSGESATVTDVDVDGRNVYLMLEETLEPDETPMVDLATGASILDLAGNESTDRRLEGIEVNDGILPTFTISLSGGTGLNEDIDGEGSSELTRSQMTISVESNEDIQGAPQFSVVCSNLSWDGDTDDNNVAKFASNRTGAFTSTDIGMAAPGDGHKVAPTGDAADTRTLCGDDGYLDVAVTSALARPGNRWEYLWANLSGEAAVPQGKLSVIVWGRDRSSYDADDTGTKKLLNYSSATSTFNLDTELMAAWDSENGLVPDNGDDVFEPRPFVLLDFEDEKTTVNVTKFTIDKVDYTADLQILDDNEFVWWPEPLDYGKYTVYVEANDAANNKGDHTYSFTVKERSPFVLSLLAGWNSVSFPANPIDRALHAVFTNDAVDVVIGWDATNPVSPWRSASKMDGVWTTHDEYGTLNDIEARYGYWVHSTGFVTQAVKLSGSGDRATDGQPSPADIPTDTGWNFVGVVDVDGDQTQDDAGETLRNSNNDPITAAEYLGNYTRAYTWDHVNNTWDVVKADEGITIGTGVWVYYTKDHDIAP